MEAPGPGRSFPVMRTGTTLLELVVTLLLLGVLTGLSIPPAGRLRDRAASLEARESFVALVHETRSVAVERGGARLLLDGERSAAVLVARGDTLRRHRWSQLRPTGLDISGGRQNAALSFDGSGVGRFASVTVTFGEGGEAATAVVSSYGRVRRR